MAANDLRAQMHCSMAQALRRRNWQWTRAWRCFRTSCCGCSRIATNGAKQSPPFVLFNIVLFNIVVVVKRAFVDMAGDLKWSYTSVVRLSSVVVTSQFLVEWSEIRASWTFRDSARVFTMLPVLCYPILDLAYQMLVLLPNSKIQRFAFLTGAFRETLRRVGENLLDHRNWDDLYPVLSVSYTSFWTIITHANSLRIKSPLKTIQDVYLKHLKRL